MQMTSFYCAASAYLELVHYAGLVHISESVYSYIWFAVLKCGVIQFCIYSGSTFRTKGTIHTPGTNQQL